MIMYLILHCILGNNDRIPLLPPAPLMPDMNRLPEGISPPPPPPSAAVTSLDHPNINHVELSSAPPLFEEEVVENKKPSLLDEIRNAGNKKLRSVKDLPNKVGPKPVVRKHKTSFLKYYYCSIFG